MNDAYRDALAFLLGRIDFERAAAIPYGAGDYKLDRMRDLLARLGDPQGGLPIVHVAGTKGKGSTSAAIAAVLTAAGYRTGLFTSPHLYRVEERIAVDGAAVAAEQFAALMAEVRPAADAMDAEAGGDGQPGGPTYFDLTTALALMHFSRSGCDAAVLEVGMGGRLDSTNVCRPAVSVITSISLDHTRQLGDTAAEIAREKAGIVKPGVPVISGVAEPEPRDCIRRVAALRGARLVERGRDFRAAYRAPQAVEMSSEAASFDFDYAHAGRSWRMQGVPLAMLGRHQADNAAVALAALAELRAAGWGIDETAVRRGLAGVRCPARIELVGRRPAVIVDAAHNAASVEALVAVLAESFVSHPRTLIFGTTRDKDAAAMLRLLLPGFDRVVLTRYTTNPRYVPPQELAEAAASLTNRPVLVRESPTEAWETVRATVTADELVCITGSFYLAAEMLTLVTANARGDAAPASPVAKR